MADQRKPRILVTRPMLDPVMAALDADYDIVALGRDDSIPSPQEVIAAAEGAEAICLVFYGGPAALLSALPDSVRMIASFGVGVDHIELAAAKDKGLIVTNTPDAVVDATADIAFGLIIASARKFYEREKTLREGRWTNFSPTADLGRDVTGKTLGIIGLGPIGRAVAERARGFRMKLIYHSRTRKPDAEAALGLEWREDVDAVAAEADFLSLHCALAPETRHIIDARRLGLMKPTAFLINTGRGPLVDEAALVAALRDGTIMGAGLDVYEREPKLAEGLAELDNVTLLPHIGSGTVETREAMGFRLKANLDAWFATGEPGDRVV